MAKQVLVGRASCPLFVARQDARPTRARPLSDITYGKHYIAFAMVSCLMVLSAAAADAQDVSPLVQASAPRTRIVILKARQLLELHQSSGQVKTYRVCLGLDPDGPKRIVGDYKTPEGDYYICLKNAASRFYRFLGLSYPGADDAQFAFEHGVISLEKRDSIMSSVRSGKTPPWDTALGGWVGIHGYPTDENDRRWILLLYPKPHNWTDGCVAMWNFEIDELFSKVSIGTPVSIVP